MSRFCLVLILSIFGVISGSLATPLPQLSKNTIHEYLLTNGIKLIIVENHRSPVVLSSIWYKVGGGYEHNGITGISHMLEHMMFRGTKKYPPGRLKKMITEAGGQQNAMTAADFTMYYQLVPANQLSLCLRLEADRMQHLRLFEKAFKQEQQVVMEERAMRIDDNPQALAWVRFRSAAFVNSPYHHPVIGWKSDITNYQLQDLIHWYHKWYAPNNAVIVVVGDVKPPQVLSLVRHFFGTIKPKTISTLKPRIELKGLGQRQINVNIANKLPTLFMGYNVPSLITCKHPWQAYALELLAAVLTEGDSSRLSSRLIYDKKIALSVDASYPIYSLHAGLFEIDAVPTNTHSLEQLQRAILKQIKLLKLHPIAASELNRVKVQLIAAYIYSQDSLMHQAMQLGIPEMSGLSWRDGRDYINNIQAITSTQVLKVAKKFLIDNQLTIAKLKSKTKHKLGK